MKTKKGFTLVELLIVIAMVAIIPAIVFGLSLWTDRNMDFALTWFKGVPVNCPMWLSVIITIVGNGLTLAFNIIMEILRLVK